MPNKQYLFRLHYGFDPAAGDSGDFYLPDDSDMLAPSLGKRYRTQYHFSLPEDFRDLTQVANQLVWADACLHIGLKCFAVAVFQLEEGRAADSETPTMVLNLFKTPECDLYSRIHSEPEEGGHIYWWDVHSAGGNLSANISHWKFDGFASFDLVDGAYAHEPETVKLNEWLAANIHRAVSEGKVNTIRRRHCIAREDYFRSKKGNIILNPRGTLWRHRFPLWAGAIESMQWGHSGYAINSDYSVSRQPIEHSDRSLRGISYMAQQERMNARRLYIHDVLETYWEFAVFRLMTALRLGELTLANSWQTYTFQWLPDTYITETKPPFNFFDDMLRVLQHFCNTAAFALGNDTTVIEMDYPNLYHGSWAWDNLMEAATSYSPSREYVPLHNKTKCIEVLQKLIDLVGKMVDDRNHYDWARVNLPREHSNNHQINAILYATHMSDVGLYASRYWPVYHDQFIEALNLLFQWDLLFDPAVKRRGENAEEELRSSAKIPILNYYGDIHRDKVDSLMLPRFDWRFSESMPKCAAFYPIKLLPFPTNAQDAQNAQRVSDLWEDVRQFQYQLQLAEENKKQERKMRRFAEIAELNAARVAEHVPDPEDVYDWRNWAHGGNMKERIWQPINVDFALNALDVPDEIEEAEDKYSEIGRGLEIQHKTPALFKIAKYLYKASPHRRLRTVLYGIKRIIKVFPKGDSPRERAVDYAADKTETALEGYEPQNTGYSPRQFLPDFGFDTDAENQDARFEQENQGIDGGSGGGGGTGRTW